MTRRPNDKMDCGLKEMHQIDYDLQEMNDAVTKAEVM